MKDRKWVLPVIIGLEAIIVLTMAHGNLASRAMFACFIALGALLVAFMSGFISSSPFARRYLISLTILLSFGTIGSLMGDADTSEIGGAYATKRCAYCKKKFKGKGYYHISTSCEQESGNGWEGNHCSLKCCSEDWANNGINSK